MRQLGRFGFILAAGSFLLMGSQDARGEDPAAPPIRGFPVDRLLLGEEVLKRLDKPADCYDIEIAGREWLFGSEVLLRPREGCPDEYPLAVAASVVQIYGPSSPLCALWWMEGQPWKPKQIEALRAAYNAVRAKWQTAADDFRKSIAEAPDAQRRAEWGELLEAWQAAVDSFDLAKLSVEAFECDGEIQVDLMPRCGQLPPPSGDDSVFRASLSVSCYQVLRRSDLAFLREDCP